MTTEKSVVDRYATMNKHQRIDTIFRLYGTILRIVKSYEDIISEEIMENIISNRRAGCINLGIKMSGYNMSNPTCRDATDHADIIHMIRYGNLDDLLDGIDGGECYREEILKLRQIRCEYADVERAMYILGEAERKEFRDVLLKKKTLDGFAEDNSILYESAKKRLYRNRNRVRKHAIELMNRRKERMYYGKKSL